MFRAPQCPGEHGPPAGRRLSHIWVQFPGFPVVPWASPSTPNREQGPGSGALPTRHTQITMKMFYWYSQSTSQKSTTRRARGALPLFLCPHSWCPAQPSRCSGPPGPSAGAAPAWGSMQQGCGRSGRCGAGLPPVASDGRGELRPAAATCRQREHLPRALRGPAPAQGRPAVRTAPRQPRARRRGAAAARAPAPRRRPSGGG